VSESIALRSRHVATPTGVVDALVRVVAGRIAAVEPGAAAADALDVGERWLLPGLVDTHVHINEPGRAEWEGFATATAAAAAGGVTTLVDMPLNSIPATTTAAAFAAKRDTAQGKCRVDVALWGGVVPGNAGELEALARAGAPGFKCFLAPSGVDEFEPVGERDLLLAMPVIARLGLPLLVHAESPAVLGRAARAATGDPRRYATWLAARPPEAEVEAVAMLVRLAAATGCRVHVVHVAAAEVVPLLRAARARGIPVTAETCPHYLTFAAEEIGDGRTEFKCAPPIRERANRERLWEALRAGDIDLVATDHSPCPPVLKLPGSGDFMAAWGGIASLELSLRAMWTAARVRGFGPADLARWMSAAPARLAGLAARKGAIVAGADADLVVFDPEPESVVDAARLAQRHPVTPYAGASLRGRIERVWVRGACVFAEGRTVGAPAGELLAVPAVDDARRKP